MARLVARFGKGAPYVRFDAGYPGYEAAEDIDCIWEHRVDDLAQLGV